MLLITSTAGGESPSHPLRALTLKVLGAYVAFVACVNLWRLAGGTGSIMLLPAQVLVLVAVVLSLRSRTTFWRGIGDWLPLIVLPMLYWELPRVSVGDGRFFDSLVQRWDMVLFGTEPARTWAGALPSRPLSELLHLAYLHYYAIIYLPPVILYAAALRRGPFASLEGELDEGKRPFHATVFALTVTVVISFAAFSVFPVEGPRFAWGAPPEVPQGPIRTFTLFLLEHGSARGTAFPSSHVAIALAQTLSSLRWRRGLGIAAAITTLLLSIGAVYGGFHYVSDILAGGLVGLIAWTLARRMEPRESGPLASER